MLVGFMYKCSVLMRRDIQPLEATAPLFFLLSDSLTPTLLKRVKIKALQLGSNRGKKGLLGITNTRNYLGKKNILYFSKSWIIKHKNLFEKVHKMSM